MKIISKALLCALTTFVVTSCSIYHPQAVDIPLIDHEGDTRVDVSAAMSYWIIPSTVTLNATVSHGFSDWFAGQAHVNFGGDNFYLQVAPGAYRPLGKHGLLEGYAGLGFGSSWNDNVESTSRSANNNDYCYSGTYLLPFVQGNIGLRNLTPIHIDLALGIKVGAYLPNFNYYELDANDNKIPSSEYDYTTPNFVFEPQAMLRFGGEHLRFNIKVALSLLSDVANGNSSHNFYYDIFSTSAGLTFFF